METPNQKSPPASGCSKPVANYKNDAATRKRVLELIKRKAPPESERREEPGGKKWRESALGSMLKAAKSLTAQCCICGLFYGNVALLKQHVKRVHLEERTHKCRFCDFRGFLKLEVQLHEKRVHSDERPVKCGQCSYTASDPYALESHLATHRALKQFRCSLCPYTCGWKQQLTRHNHAHASPDRVVCGVCGLVSRNKKQDLVHFSQQHAPAGHPAPAPALPDPHVLVRPFNATTRPYKSLLLAPDTQRLLRERGRALDTAAGAKPLSQLAALLCGVKNTPPPSEPCTQSPQLPPSNPSADSNAKSPVFNPVPPLVNISSSSQEMSSSKCYDPLFSLVVGKKQELAQESLQSRGVVEGGMDAQHVYNHVGEGDMDARHVHNHVGEGGIDARHVHNHVGESDMGARHVHNDVGESDMDARHVHNDVGEGGFDARHVHHHVGESDMDARHVLNHIQMLHATDLIRSVPQPAEQTDPLSLPPSAAECDTMRAGGHVTDATHITETTERGANHHGPALPCNEAGPEMSDVVFSPRSLERSEAGRSAEMSDGGFSDGALSSRALMPHEIFETIKSKLNAMNVKVLIAESDDKLGVNRGVSGNGGGGVSVDVCGDTGAGGGVCGEAGGGVNENACKSGANGVDSLRGGNTQQPMNEPYVFSLPSNDQSMQISDCKHEQNTEYPMEDAVQPGSSSPSAQNSGDLSIADNNNEVKADVRVDDFAKALESLDMELQGYIERAERARACERFSSQALSEVKDTERARECERVESEVRGEVKDNAIVVSSSDVHEIISLIERRVSAETVAISGEAPEPSRPECPTQVHVTVQQDAAHAQVTTAPGAEQTALASVDIAVLDQILKNLLGGAGDSLTLRSAPATDHSQ